jgi:hypothetical protein
MANVIKTLALSIFFTVNQSFLCACAFGVTKKRFSWSKLKIAETNGTLANKDVISLTSFH